MSDHPAASAPPPAIPDSESRPFVRDVGDRRSLHFSEQVIQSSMSLLNPDALELGTRMMMGFVLFNPAPDRIVMVGLGGGSLAKFCHRHLPRSQVEALEINPAVIALRGDFMVPPDDERFRVIACDAAEFLRDASDHADVILLDGFGDQGMPDALCSGGVLCRLPARLARRRPAGDRFHVNHPLYHEYAARVRESFGAAMFEVVDDDMTNSIVFACKGDLLDDPASARLRRPALSGCMASVDADLARHRRDADAALDEPTVGRRGKLGRRRVCGLPWPRPGRSRFRTIPISAFPGGR